MRDQVALGQVGPAYWRRPWFLLALSLLTAVPLLLPDTPPLVDLPGHLGRYRIQLDLDSSEHLQRFFAFDWQLIGNLGVDLLVVPLAALVGLEPAVKLIVIAIPPLTAAGIFWTAHEVHGRVPPMTLFAIPFAYSFPFNFGFINFALSIAFAFLALAWWLSLTRNGRFRLRAAFFLAVSCVVWLCHAFGWGVLGVLVWGSEFARTREDGRTTLKSGVAATLSCAPLMAPIVLMALWRGGTAEGLTSGFFQFDLKLFALSATLRDRWLPWDALGAAAALVLLAAPAFDRRLSFAPALAVPALLFAILFLLFPTKLFGSAYADARLVPVAIMVGLTALRLRPPAANGAPKAMAALGCLFIAARLGGNFVSFAQADSEARQHLAVVEPVPMGSRVLFLAEQQCGLAWALPRTSHLGSFVIVRRYGFANDQWDVPGAQLLRIVYEVPDAFRADPSQFFVPEACSGANESAVIRYAGGGSSQIPSREAALAGFPRAAFDYVWVIGAPAPGDALHPELTPLRRTARSVLFLVQRHDRRDAQSGTRLR